MVTERTHERRIVCRAHCWAAFLVSNLYYLRTIDLDRWSFLEGDKSIDRGVIQGDTFNFVVRFSFLILYYNIFKICIRLRNVKTEIII